jgi:predicted TIM-barrel fold metal-dependent hydrolase
MFSPDRPLYHPDFEPIWNTIADLEMVVTNHSGFTGTSDVPIETPGAPHPGCSQRIFAPDFYFICRNVLSHLIWGGVLERHPTIRVAFTEQGSGWVPQVLRDMDYSYDGSYARTDVREVIRSMPSEYFQRQCYLGSSIFSRAEIEARHAIGINKMMLGMDYPHHEGTIVQSTRAYLRATLGAARVPVSEARLLLGETAATVYGFDLERLTRIAAGVNLRSDEILTPPEVDLFPRGDVHRPGMIA